ncbi:MAG: hypothetical protein Q8P24_05685, partial [Desulfobacterales bacterium]|nr:hypothetical protein [Desulfobacterales bacterium]
VPPYVQRLFISKDTRAIKNGTLWSGLFSIPFFFMTGAIGLVALALFPAIDANLALPYMIKNTMPVVLKGVVISGVISIVMSSADSFLNAAAVSFVRDIVDPLTKGKLNEFLLVKAINLAVGMIAVVFAVNIRSILDILIYSYNFWSPILLIPLVAGIMGMKVGPRNFYWGMAGGIFGVAGWNLIFNSPLGIDGLIIGVLLNGLFFTVSGRWRQPDP